MNKEKFKMQRKNYHGEASRLSRTFGEVLIVPTVERVGSACKTEQN